MSRLKSKLALCIVGLLFIMQVSACSAPPNASSSGEYPVDPTFSDFYREVGGEEAMGPAISPGYSDNGVTYQYVVSGLIVYDPNEVALRRFHFSPIASAEWQINFLPEPAPDNNDPHYINGHKVWEEILPFYDQYGSDIIGAPITSVVVNDVKQRYEQYFEGIGFYRDYTDPPGQIHMMPYGAWMCGNKCGYRITDARPPAASYSREYSATEQLFLQASDRFGYGFSGAPLSVPRLGKDNNYEMVFENVIMYIDPSNGSQIRLRPLPAWLGIQPDIPGLPISAGWLSFFEIQDGLGFNVPNTFKDYLADHGSSEYAGKPTTEYKSLKDSGFSQCFTNLCLEYHPTAPAGLQVRLHTLGLDYLSMGSTISTPGAIITKALQITAWEANPLIPSGQNQVITVKASQNNLPLKGIELSLIVKQPDGITKTYKLAPTSDDGETSVQLDPINGPNGAIIQYEVCVIGSESTQICFSKSYTLWDQ